MLLILTAVILSLVHRRRTMSVGINSAKCCVSHPCFRVRVLELLQAGIVQPRLKTVRSSTVKSTWCLENPHTLESEDTEADRRRGDSRASECDQGSVRKTRRGTRATVTRQLDSSYDKDLIAKATGQ